MIETMESLAAGRTPEVAAGFFAKALRHLRDFDDADPLESQIAHLYHEYLWSPQFKEDRDRFIVEGNIKASALKIELAGELEQAGFFDLAKQIQGAKASFTFKNVAVFDRALTSYLTVGLGEFESLQWTSRNITQINERLDRSGSRNVRLRENPISTHPATFVVRSGDEEWIFNLST